MTDYIFTGAGDPNANGIYVGGQNDGPGARSTYLLTFYSVGDGTASIYNGSTGPLYQCPSSNPLAFAWTVMSGTSPAPNVRDIATAVLATDTFIALGAGDEGTNGRYVSGSNTTAGLEASWLKVAPGVAGIGFCLLGNDTDGVLYHCDGDNPANGVWLTDGLGSDPPPTVTTDGNIQATIYNQLVGVITTLGQMTATLASITASITAIPTTITYTGPSSATIAAAVRTNLAIGTGKFTLYNDNTVSSRTDSYGAGQDPNTRLTGGPDNTLGTDGSGNVTVHLASAAQAALVDATMNATSITVDGARTTSGNPLVLSSRQLDAIKASVLAGNGTSTVPVASGTATQTYYLIGKPQISANAILVVTVHYDSNRQQTSRTELFKEPFPVLS